MDPRTRTSLLAGSIGLLVTGVLLAAPVVAQPTPVTVAVDTSRSLRPGDLGDAVEQLAETLAQLPSDQPTGLLAFDDRPRWVVPVGGTPADVAAALSSLEPAGRFTQLHDALVVAARAMEVGGVILLVTDGRDEDSATTLEDVSRVCESQGVRILPLAMGPQLQERSLRRLALLTGGEYLGPADSGTVVDAVTRARSEIGRDRASSRSARSVPTPTTRPQEPPPPRAEPADPEAATPADSGETFPLPLILALVTILVLAAVLARLLSALARTGDGGEDPINTAYCPICGSSLPEEDAPCDHCREDDLIARLRGRRIMELRDTAEMPVQKAGASIESFDPGVLEVTRVLADENMITLRGNGVEPRSYLLSSETAFAVGRDSRGNTVGLPDGALSAHHFKIVPDDGAFFVIDLESTNGTYVNDQPIRTHRLKTGDVIRAGRSEFEYRSKARALS